MIVAVPVVRMMQMRPDRVVEVVAVRHALVPAVGAVRVAAGVLGAVVRRRAARRIAGADGDSMLVDVIAVDVVQVAVVEIVGVAVVLEGRVAAAATVLMSVPGMHLTWHVATSVGAG